MKMPKAMMAMMLCAGLVAALGLVACGDDDDDEEPGLSCEEAMDEFLSDDCQNEATAAAVALDLCADPCDGDEGCVNDCLDAFIDASPDCKAAADKLFAEGTSCDCAGLAGNAFFECVLVPEADAQDCLDTLETAIQACNLLT